MDEKQALHGYLQAGRDALLGKLDGASERDARRPLTPTGTNLLGLVKHTASVEAGYLGDTFGRPFPLPLPWFEEGAQSHPDIRPNADMWATAEESREEIVALYHRAWAHSDATIEQLDLDAAGTVPHWPAPRDRVTLHRILVHLIAETHRHAGHADIVRELVDGAAGMRSAGDNLPDQDAGWWRAYRERLQRTADGFAASPGDPRVAAALAGPLQRALDARLVDDADPTAGVTFPVTGLAVNGAGGLHAAALSTVLEVAGYLAVLPTLAPDEHAVTHAISTQLVAPAPEGAAVVVTATLDRRTRRLAFVGITATCEGVLVARAQLTKSVVTAR